MNKTGPLIAVVAVLVLIVGGIFVVSSKKDNKTQTTTTPPIANNVTEPGPAPAPTANPSTSATTDDKKTTNTITYTGDGFSPASLTVTSGTKITIKNDAATPLQFSSDPHPEHTDNPELNASMIAEGQSTTVTVTKKGTWGYHNHLKADDIGKIVVQ